MAELQPPAGVDGEGHTARSTAGWSATVVMLVGQAMVGSGEVTVTVKLHVALLPHVSLAVVVTWSCQSGRCSRWADWPRCWAALQPPLAVTVKNTTAPLGPVAAVVMLLGQLMVTCG